MSSVVEKIRHCQRNIKKYSDKEEKMLHYIQRLYNLPVTVQHLQDTGVGRTVNGLRKYEGGVGDASRALVAKWKAMVADEETSEGEDDEACVPDAPESYDSPESPILKKKQEADSTVKISRHEPKSEKNEISEHSLKHSSRHEIKSKSENESNINKESSKSLKHESQKEKHDKSHSKHESRDKRSYSNEAKSSSSSSMHVKKSVDKSSSHSNKLDNITDKQEEYIKKRKLDNSNNGKKKHKKPKLSENESDDDRTSSYNTNKQNINEFHTELNKKTHIVLKQEDVNKVESKKEKSKSREKVKSSSSSKEEKVHDDKSKKKSEESREKQKTDSHRSSKSSKSKSHHSSSSRDHVKDKDKDKDKSKRKENEERKHKHQSKSSSDSKESKSGSKESKEKVKIKQEINGDEGIDCNSGASFAEALGMCTVAPGSRKRHNNSPNLNPSRCPKLETNVSSTPNNKKQSSVKIEATSSDSLHPLPLLAPNVKLEPLSVNLAFTLPEISPNYKPLSYINPIHRKEEDKTLTDVIHVKNQRTKVYSGNKTGYTSVPSLYEICIRVLIENIDALEFTGGVPYDIIKPVLERATADQLYMLEHYNPYLIEDTDSLWQFHCNREFRNKQRQEMESWREMYMRCLNEREEKLKTLTANIKQSIDKTVPLRSAKLAYVDNVVKPPRNILKKQAKYGTNSIPMSTSDLKKKLIVSGGPTAATNISVPPPLMNRASSSMKKTKAPLMAKALQLIKGRYKR